MRLAALKWLSGLAAIAALQLAGAAQAETWEELVAAARKEGTVVVHVLSGEGNRIGRTADWAKDFPDIKMQILNTSTTEVLPKMIREKQAGLYTIDVSFGGCTDFVGIYKQNDLIRPFEEAILDKELLKDEYWRDGWKKGYCDKEQKWAYSYQRTAVIRASINWDFVDRKKLTSLDDLLKPEFNGKIGWYDPRAPGVGYGFANALLISKGEDFMRKLWSMNATYSSNHRLVTEWMVRGRAPIGLGVGPDRLKEFQDQGLCKNCESIPAEWFEKPSASSGSGSIVYLKNVPHPNAAKLYINWFLQKKQQQNWNNATGQASRRLDVTVTDPDALPKPGLKWIDSADEEHLHYGKRTLELANEVITAKAQQ